MQDIRWKQRFCNFEKAYFHLKEACSRADTNDWLLAAGIIQTFEFTFELGWKTIQDLMKQEGELVRFPREVIKKAFQLGILIDGECWIDMLEKRNGLAHIYNEKAAIGAVVLIKESYLPAITQLYDWLKTRSDERD